ncbi:lysoplasmalogenase [Muriicola sp. Z0-33]|uniref:lysoplasmalogenase n=1 Tax=Muriicola sp. Z0-33 TaxID=2816957 RepID=UPI00223877E1|nr:lysoplasmalogenase [Muriicola sp. Z0-33]MCW5517509.1 lysoplasmalogenase [Muriicola sp. Z0-33]
MKNKSIIIAFSLVLILDLLVIGADLPQYLRYFSKPAITIVLLAYVLLKMKNNKMLKRFLILALIFSLSGDIFLLLPSEVSWYFIGGLLSFLIAHIMYISAFFKIDNFRTTKTFLATMVLLFYAMVIFKFIGGTLDGLFPYVVLYMVVLLLMVLTAIVRHDTVLKSYYLVLSGALLFMISDSLLALNKFYSSFAFADLLIMLTYGYAQFLIIFGALRHRRTTEKLWS